MASYRASGSRMNKVPMLSLLLALILGSGPQDSFAEGRHSTVSHRWYFGAALNYNLPTGQLYYPPTFNPVFSSTTTLVGGGFSYTPSFSYALRIGYDRSLTKNGVHGFVAALGLTDYKLIMDFHEYSFYYHGVLYTQHTDRYIFDDVNSELHLTYRFKKNRTSIQLGALGLIHSNRIFREYLLDGTHGKSSSTYWWRFRRWLPTVQVNYHFLTKGKLQFDGFISGDKRMGLEHETHWWDIQAGVQLSLVKQMKRKL